MTTLSHAVGDSTTMLRRNLLHALRYPSLTLSAIGTPVIFLLLFGVLLGDALAAGIGAGQSRADYIAYIAPALLAITVATGSLGTAVAVCTDMTEGIVARFRTMAIFRPAVLVGHVAASMIVSLVTLALVIGIVVLAGFRPTAGVLGWVAALGLLALLSLALTWLAVALGQVTKNAEAASNYLLPVMFLPFLGSGFVPVDSMPGAVRWFADYQPFTPIIETLRGLLTDAPLDGTDALLAVAWSVAMGLAGYLWARALFARDPVR